jgi:2-amino-4-hydroxy-6-hydroxymethyldihydropteridine diphosphokinase
MTVTTYIGLGSNLNDPARQVREAIAALRCLPNVAVAAVSSLYLTAPVVPPEGPEDQPDFINAVAALIVSMSAEDLLQQLQAIEQAMGRVRDPEQRNGPRVIDLDMLLYGDHIIEAPTLTVPHPRLYERLFALQPLFDIAPDLVLPNGKLLADLIQQLSD